MKYDWHENDRDSFPSWALMRTITELGLKIPEQVDGLFDVKIVITDKQGNDHEKDIKDFFDTFSEVFDRTVKKEVSREFGFLFSEVGEQVEKNLWHIMQQVKEEMDEDG